MRAFNLILITGLIGLWGYFFVEISPRNSRRPVAVKTGGEELSAATLNNAGVSDDKRGMYGDAVAYFERAHDFRPRDEVIATNLGRAKARLAKRGWARALGVTTVLAVLWFGFSSIFRAGRWMRDHARLSRVRLRGDPWVHIPRESSDAEIPLRFSAPVDGLVRRHPLTIVWSSASCGKHMKSRPPVKVDGREAVIKLDEERIERLRRYPGDWKGFLYLGKTPVGEAAARVG